MNYLRNGKSSGTLDNQVYDITYDDLKYLMEINAEDAQETATVTQQSRNGETYYPDGNNKTNAPQYTFQEALWKEMLYRDPKTEGFIQGYPHGYIVTHGERNHYYRGENKVFPSSISSLYRSLQQLPDEASKNRYTFIAWLRIGLFRSFLNRLDIVKEWNDYGVSVLYDCLAQHYGLETHWLDITNDFNVALFFATCCWDNTLENWRPLTKCEIDENPYGMLFHIPAYRANLINMVSAYAPERTANMILPIGFQPFMRCQYQSAYGMNTTASFVPLQENIQFEKLRFRHSEALSNCVYQMMDQGKKIYPNEGIIAFQDVIEKIKTATIFSEDEFAFAFEHTSIYESQDICKAALGSEVIIRSNSLCSELASSQRIRQFNQKNTFDSLSEYLGIPLFGRLMYFPNDQTP